jgi:hypothetical protein
MMGTLKKKLVTANPVEFFRLAIEVNNPPNSNAKIESGAVKRTTRNASLPPFEIEEPITLINRNSTNAINATLNIFTAA